MGGTDDKLKQPSKILHEDAAKHEQRFDGLDKDLTTVKEESATTAKTLSAFDKKAVRPQFSAIQKQNKADFLAVDKVSSDKLKSVSDQQERSAAGFQGVDNRP